MATIVDTFTGACVRLLQTRYWKAILTALLVSFSLFFAVPRFNYVLNASADMGWQVVMQQRDASFLYQPTGVPPTSQAAKKTFRMTVPLVAKVLRLNALGIYGLQFLLGILFVYLVIDFVQTETGDRMTAALFGIAFATLYVGRACFTDVYSRFEGWCYLLLFLSVYFRRWYLVFLFTFLACWTDERALIGAAFAALWWLFRENGPDGMFNFKAVASKRYAAVVAAVLMYVAMRYVLQTRLGYYTPTAGVGFKYILYGFRYFNFGTWTFLEGLWIPVLYKFYLLLKHRHRAFFTVNLLVLAVAVVSSFVVFDITKSGSYVFADALLALAVMARYCEPARIRTVLGYAALVCFLFPPYFIILDINPYILQQESVPVIISKLIVKRYSL